MTTWERQGKILEQMSKDGKTRVSHHTKPSRNGS